MTLDHFLGLAYAFGLTITAVLSGVSAYLVKQSHKSIEDVNDAVNHRHTRGENAPKLYDAVLHLHERTDKLDGKCDELIEWKRSYDKSPWNSGDKVLDYIEDNNKKINAVFEKTIVNAEQIKVISNDVQKIKESCPEGGKFPCHYLIDRIRIETQDETTD